jgi:hypothetical protein
MSCNNRYTELARRKKLSPLAFSWSLISRIHWSFLSLYYY